jgi:hypothetical protein
VTGGKRGVFGEFGLIDLVTSFVPPSHPSLKIENRKFHKLARTTLPL